MYGAANSIQIAILANSRNGVANGADFRFDTTFA
jgi:hypothetical protein